jgi:RimJ/RimL family protein N-acetyltransferase
MKIILKKYDLLSTHQAQELSETLGKYFSTSPCLPDVDKLLHTRIQYFRATLDGEQIGLTGFDQKTPYLAETVKTTIFTPFQGRGLGKLLSQEIEDECRRQGIKKVMTTIYATNVAMIHIKLKQGYIIEGYHPDHEAPGFHEYSLGKILK